MIEILVSIILAPIAIASVLFSAAVVVGCVRYTIENKNGKNTK